MKEIMDVEKKLQKKNDIERLEAYLKYQKYEAMLKMYQSGIELVKNLKDPFKYAGDIAEKNNFTLEEYEAFSEKVDALKKQDPEIKLNELWTAKGRETIATIISATEKDEKFKTADLDSVAVAKCYGLCKTVKDALDKNLDEQVKILQENKIVIPFFVEAMKRLEQYEKSGKGNSYDRVIRRKESERDNIIHVTAGVLEIGPGEAECDLCAYDVIEGRRRPDDFESQRKVEHDYVHYKSDYDLIERFEANIDIIKADDRLTDKQKEPLLAEQREKIERIRQKIENIKAKRADKEKIVKFHEQKYKRNQEGQQDREIG